MDVRCGQAISIVRTTGAARTKRNDLQSVASNTYDPWGGSVHERVSAKTACWSKGSGYALCPYCVGILSLSWFHVASQAVLYGNRIAG
jgi:hypothetical protein